MDDLKKKSHVFGKNLLCCQNDIFKGLGNAIGLLCSCLKIEKLFIMKCSDCYTIILLYNPKVKTCRIYYVY